MHHKTTVFAAIICIFLAGAVTGGAEGKEKNEEYSRMVKELDTPLRELQWHREKIIKTLKIEPGMDILDIGAGVGFFTLPFADALKKTGMVFATDIDNNMLVLLEKKIKKGGYANITPVLVRRDGVDAFYKQHSFDIIFLGSVYSDLSDEEQYFRELRPSLKDTGRLYILSRKADYDVAEFILAASEKAIPNLCSQGKDSPVFSKLSPEVRSYLNDRSANKSSTHIPDGIRAKILDDLHRLLRDRELFNSLYTYYKKAEDLLPGSCFYTKNHESFMLIQWLVTQLNKKGILEDKNIPLDKEDENYLHALNSILLLDSFRIRGPSAYSIFADKNSIRKTLEKAGYELTSEFHFINTQVFLEFKKKS